jgi:hypothetical protein
MASLSDENAAALYQICDSIAVSADTRVDRTALIDILRRYETANRCFGQYSWALLYAQANTGLAETAAISAMSRLYDEMRPYLTTKESALPRYHLAARVLRRIIEMLTVLDVSGPRLVASTILGTQATLVALMVLTEQPIDEITGERMRLFALSKSNYTFAQREAILAEIMDANCDNRRHVVQALVERTAMNADAGNWAEIVRFFTPNRLYVMRATIDPRLSDVLTSSHYLCIALVRTNTLLEWADEIAARALDDIRAVSLEVPSMAKHKSCFGFIRGHVHEKRRRLADAFSFYHEAAALVLMPATYNAAIAAPPSVCEFLVARAMGDAASLSLAAANARSDWIARESFVMTDRGCLQLEAARVLVLFDEMAERATQLCSRVYETGAVMAVRVGAALELARIHLRAGRLDDAAPLLYFVEQNGSRDDPVACATLASYRERTARRAAEAAAAEAKAREIGDFPSAAAAAPLPKRKDPPPVAAAEVPRASECSVCMDAPYDTALACGHVLCATCAKVTTCPFCSAAVTSRIRLFIS